MEIKMKTSTKQARNFLPTIGRLALAITLGSAIGSLCVTPAFGQRNDDRPGFRDNGARHVENRGDRDRNFRERRPMYRHPYHYAAPVYAPPPVYYPPRPSPGFSLFFPLDVRIR
jgi:hypothetical protein